VLTLECNDYEQYCLRRDVVFVWSFIFHPVQSGNSLSVPVFLVGMSAKRTAS